MRIAIVEKAFNEGKVLLEALQTLFERDPRGQNHPEITFDGDRGGVLARLCLKRILAQEAAAFKQPA